MIVFASILLSSNPAERVNVINLSCMQEKHLDGLLSVVVSIWTQIGVIDEDQDRYRSRGNTHHKYWRNQFKENIIPTLNLKMKSS